MRQFYEEESHRFHARDRVEVAEILLPSEDEARRVRAEIEDARDIAALASERSIRPGVAEHHGMFPMDRLGDLVPAILKAQVGELVGPVEVRNGFSVFEVVTREKGGLKPFAQVRREIRGILRRAEERRAFQRFLEGLRERYSDRVRIDDAELAAALPDGFLADL